MRPREQLRAAARGFLPLALGHVASVALVAGALLSGLALDRSWLQALACGLCAAAVIVQLSRRAPQLARAPAKHAGLAFGSFALSTAHGSGLLLVPALAPFCLGDASAAAMSAEVLGSVLAGLTVHAAAMLAVTGVLAGAVCGGWLAWGRLFARFSTSRCWN